MKEKFFYKKIKEENISCVFTEPDRKSKNIVIMAHGFRSSSIGSSRKFVTLSRKLAEKGISSLRFDQPGSGNSSGDFYDSSFNDWIKTIQSFTKEYIGKQFRVALMGESMGATAVIDSLEDLQIRKNIYGIALWVPDPKIDRHEINGKYMEEGGQRVNKNYWVEASSHNFMKNLVSYDGDRLIIYGEKDEHISASSRKKVIIAAKRPRSKVIILKGENHSNWSYPQMKKAIDNTADFFVNALTERRL
ncbi:MAG: alpha/beta hydrolase [bacterium]|nr:alpha/beta hydrolase [bacterium]